MERLESPKAVAESLKELFRSLEKRIELASRSRISFKQYFLPALVIHRGRQTDNDADLCCFPRSMATTARMPIGSDNVSIRKL